MKDISDLYFEAHITVEPLFDGDLERFKTLVSEYGFRAADLLMQKRQNDTPERSRFDTFATGRSQSFSDLKSRMTSAIQALTDAGVKVWRYKIEDTILDSRSSDALNLLPESSQ